VRTGARSEHVHVGETSSEERIYFMRVENPVRLGGFAAILAGVLLVVSDLLRLYIVNLAGTAVLDSIFFVEGWVSVLLAVVVQLGLVGLYAPYARAAGILGLIGLILASVGIELTMGSSFAFPFDRPTVWPWETEEYWEEPLAAILVLGLSFVLGCVLLGIAMLRARVYPRAAVALFIVGALILLTPLALSDVIFAVALVWLGYAIYARRGEEAPQPTPA
jgi:hypothetical protein